jgi:glycogen debranching enzyme
MRLDHLAMIAALAVAGADTAGAQAEAATARTVPWFSLGESPIALRGPVRHGTYLAAVGRRGIAMGTEEGRFELWTWPLKWLHDFQLSFRVPKYTAPIAGHTVASAVEHRPEGVTIRYAHEQFTVRQHVFVPLDLPAIVMLLEVDAVRPLDIVAQFIPDIHYAWPAGLGGQYLVWNQPSRAFLFSEGRRAVNAFLGSPAVTEASDVPAHMLAAAPPQLVLGVGGAGERYTAPRLGEPPGRQVNLRTAWIPIVLAGGAMPRDSALALYRRLTTPGAAEYEWRRRVAHADSIRTTQFAIRSPDPLLNAAVEHAKVNLDEAFACNPDLGCGLVAGFGLSGASSDRPGFGWYFGGDAAINSLAMTAAGQAPLVRDGVLRFFAKYQRADGKITHEISQASARVDWYAYPYAFYHGDTTPFWILAFGEYWRQTADTALVRELWPNLRRAFEWSRATDTDGDGLMENPAAGAGAIEVGDLGTGILSDVYLSGVWVASLGHLARMAEAVGEAGLADTARAIAGRAAATMESRLWLPQLGQYAFALLQGGLTNDNLTAWPAAAMAFGVLDDARGAAMASQLASSAIMTDWGARPLGAASSLFDPLHYNNGAVWGFVTGFVSLAQYRHHNPAAGWFALRATAATGFDHALGRNPEVISGRLYQPLDTAVPHQFFATSMVLTPLIRGLLGLEVDAPARRLTIAPHLPPGWDSVAVDNVPVGSDRVSFVLRRGGRGMVASVRRTGGDDAPLEVIFSPALPHGAVAEGAGVTASRFARDMHGIARALLRDQVELRVGHGGGWSIEPPETRPMIGDRSHAPRVLEERIGADGQYQVIVEGLAGRSYTFRVHAPDQAAASGLLVSAGGGGSAVAGKAAGETRWVEITLPRSGANADGYTTASIGFRRGG